jgi:hypothetical protein
MPENVIKPDYKKLKRIPAVLTVLLFLIIPFNYLPDHEFAFLPTPHGGSSGGINGVYTHEDIETCGEYAYSYKILRFYEDGTVLYVSTCSDGDIINDWIDIRKWFHQNANAEISRGNYFIAEDQIWFTTTVYYKSTGESVIIDCSGMFSENNLILSSYSHFNGREEKNIEYLKMNVE